MVVGGDYQRFLIDRKALRDIRGSTVIAATALTGGDNRCTGSDNVYLTRDNRGNRNIGTAITDTVYARG